MARKRMLVPGIWHDSKVIQLSNDEFIVWIGCISIADDEGIIEPEPNSMYFELARRGLTAEGIRDALNRIAALEMIVFYDEGKYAFLPSWFKHQTLNRPSQTKLKRPPRSLVTQYPDYIASWEATFSYYKGKGDDRELISASYPYREDSVNTHENLSDDSVNTHRELTPNRIEEKGIEEKGIEEKRILEPESREIIPSDESNSDPPEMPPLSPMKDSVANYWQDELTRRFPPEAWTDFKQERIQLSTLAKKTNYLFSRTPYDSVYELVDALIEVFEIERATGKDGYWKKASLTPSMVSNRWSQLCSILEDRWKNKQDEEDRQAGVETFMLRRQHA